MSGAVTDVRPDEAPKALIPALELNGVSKAFGPVRAVTDASLTCRAGEVHALIGENGAGKSTLIKIAAGVLRPDTGSVRICGSEVDRGGAREVRRMGLFTAYQDTSLVHGLTVAENLQLSFAGAGAGRRNISAQGAAELLAPFDLPFGPRASVGSLSPGSRQLLEIVRTLLHDPKVLILDEPTAALDAGNIERLEALIRRASEGGTAILYISHRLDEVRRLANRVTVIRDGHIIETQSRGEWDVEEIVALMVGEATDLAFPDKVGVGADAAPGLAVKDFEGDGFGPVDIRVSAGEIVGVAGAEGNGQRDFLRTVVGLRRGSGTIEVGGEEVQLRSPAAALAAGVSFQSGDRAAESIFRELSVSENSTAAVRRELGPGPLVLRRQAKERFGPVAKRLGIVRASDAQPAGELSGGNQQKAVLARALLRDDAVLVVDEPTAGVDARARLDIYQALRERADRGTAIVINSSDSLELEGLCDRVYVFSRGQIVGELSGGDVTETTIVDRFVNRAAKAKSGAAKTSAPRAPGGRSNWLPQAMLLAIIVALGAYTATQSSLFLSAFNLHSLMLLTLPLAIVALGEQVLLLSGGFDISVSATMSLTVVLSSFWLASGSLGGSILAVLGLLAVGVLIGISNGGIVRRLGVSPVIATIGTLGILGGVALLLRPEPGGAIALGVTEFLGTQIGQVPVACIVVAVVAIAAEFVLFRSTLGLQLRAAGMAEEAAGRTGIPVERLKLGAYVLCAVIAVVAGLFLAAQVSIGDSTVGKSYALLTFTACFLGGASLTGGYGSFVGAVLGAILLSLLVNITPLLELPASMSTLVSGVLTVVAVLGYSLAGRFSLPRRSGAGGGPAPTPTAVPEANG
jgi:ribose transport system ATP-binding protein